MHSQGKQLTVLYLLHCSTPLVGYDSAPWWGSCYEKASYFGSLLPGSLRWSRHGVVQDKVAAMHDSVEIYGNFMSVLMADIALALRRKAWWRSMGTLLHLASGTVRLPHTGCNPVCPCTGHGSGCVNTACGNPAMLRLLLLLLLLL